MENQHSNLYAKKIYTYVSRIPIYKKTQIKISDINKFKLQQKIIYKIIYNLVGTLHLIKNI